MFILQVIGVVIFIYGLFSLIQDITNEITYKNICHNMKIIIFTKDLEKNIDKFLVEFHNMKKVSGYHQMMVVDLKESDDINKIKTRFLNNELNIDLLNKKDGKVFIEKIYENSF